MSLHARIAALDPIARARLIARAGAPRHLLSPDSAPGEVLAHELVAWASGLPGGPARLDSLLDNLEPPA